MFRNCNSLISLPDISEWDTHKVRHIDDMFNGCNSLSSFPNIFKWNLSNVYARENVYKECLNGLNIKEDI